MGLLTNFKQNDVFRDEKSLAFDGSNDYVQLGSAFNYNVHSISAWVKFNADTTHKFIFDARDANDDGIMFFITSAEKIMYSINAVDGVYDSVLTEGVWYHFVGTNDGTTSRIYLNGVEVETADTSGTTINTTTSGTIATQSFSTPGHLFNGNISEVVFYTSALTANQVKTIYNGREPYNHKEGVASGNLQAWYRMGDGVLDDYALIGDETNITLGNNLITNGTFDADSDWAKSGSGATISSGQATLDLDADTFIYQDVGTIGKVYKMTFDLVVTSGEVKLGTNADFQYTYSAGTYTNESVYLIATTTNRFIFRRATGDLEATIDNVSVQQVGDNAGIMNNMSATDIEGDTP